jgi:hypothetical protein
VGLKSNGIYQFLVDEDTKYTGTLTDASREVGLEINVEKIFIASSS